jgi:hypothetical protein
MNYTYEIADAAYSNTGKEIIEFLDNQFNNSWYLLALKNNTTPFMLADLNSFKRTQQWILNNHPELLL